MGLWTEEQTGVSLEERERAVFRSRRKFLADLESDLAASARIRWRESRGAKWTETEAGKEAEKRASIRFQKLLAITERLLEADIPLDDIAAATDLGVATLKSLRGSYRALGVGDHLPQGEVEPFTTISKQEREWKIFGPNRFCQADRETCMAALKSIGMEEGEEETRLDITKKLLSMDAPIDTIAAATGLTLEELEALRDG
jgi:hypothetical protein